jgi:hypothetical protein
VAYEESIRSITLDADASLGIYTGVPGLPGSANPNGGKQYHFVKVTGAHTCGVASAVGDKVIGVLQNKPQTTGAAATVAIRGVSKVVSDKAVAAGTEVYLSADGQATDVTTSATRVGVALSTTTAAGELLVVLLQL